MLINFKVGNYKSIKDKITVDFTAASISEHSDSNIFQADKESLLKSVLLYGPNASGKSKIIDAFIFFRHFIRYSAVEQPGDEAIDVDYFRLSDTTEGQPSYFEASFLIGELKYRYGFEANAERVTKEWLLETKVAKENHLFLRIEDEFDIDIKRFKNAEGLEKRTRKNALFLSVASQWNVEKAEIINTWLSSIFTVHGLRDNRLFRDLTIKMLSDPEYTDLIHKFIQKADLGINGIDVVDVQIKMPNITESVTDDGVKRGIYRSSIRRDSKTVLAIHNKYGKDNELIGGATFQLDKDESEGTKKYFGLVGVFISALLEGRLVVIDEFDARLHTLLSKAILKLFNSSRIKSKAQLFIASHDTALLDREILRRDQIYFVEKNQFGATNIISLVEYKPRKESPYDKNYLEGKYGAIPFIEDLEILIENGQKART